MRRVTTMVATGLLLAGGVTLSSATAATADPVYPSADQVQRAKEAVTTAAATVASLEASLAVASSRLEQLQVQVQIAAEAFDQAKIELDQRTAAATQAQAQAKQAQDAADQAQSDVGQLAVDSYYNGQGLGGLEVLLGARTPQELLNSAASYRIANTVIEQTFQRAQASRVVAGVMRRQADAAVAEQKAAADKLEQARRSAQAKADAAAAETASIQAQRTSMITQLASLKKTSVALETQRQNGLEAERRAKAEAARKAAAAKAAKERREAEARREAERRRQNQASGSSNSGSSNSGSSNSGSSGSGSTDSGSGSSQGSASGGVTAANWAKTQLGKDYEWAAEGPSTYDCSGLTMRAWQRAGVNLPHSSRMQYQVTKHVSYDNIRIGDLVFFGTSSDPSTIHHVGIYIGGGQMVEAPYTGAQVRISTIWRSGLMPYAGRP